MGHTATFHTICYIHAASAVLILLTTRALFLTVNTELTRMPGPKANIHVRTPLFHERLRGRSLPGDLVSLSSV